MSDVETKNAVITGTMLGIEDHGIFTAFVDLDYGGSGQGFGGYCLGYPPDSKKSGNAAATFIQEVLRLADVTKWEDLKGRPVRVRTTQNKVLALGHFMKEEWFYPGDMKND